MCMTKKELENKINELRSLKALQQETADEGKSNVYIAYSQIDGHYETAQAYEDLIQKIDEYRMERKSSKFDNPMYNKGYEDGFADGANSIEE